MANLTIPLVYIVMGSIAFGSSRFVPKGENQM